MELEIHGKRFVVRDIMPLRVVDNMARMHNAGKDPIDINHYFMREMVLEPELTEEFLASDEADARVFSRLIEELTKMFSVDDDTAVEIKKKPSSV